MDTKRKANGTATPDTDDRAAKRRKVAVSPPVLQHTQSAQRTRARYLLDATCIQKLSQSLRSPAHIDIWRAATANLCRSLSICRKGRRASRPQLMG